MAKKSSIFWTHGVDVVVEYTREYTRDDNGLFLRRAGWGAVAKQNPGTENWFHFAIPTPQRIDDTELKCCDAMLQVQIAGNAIIDTVALRATYPQVRVGEDHFYVMDNEPLELRVLSIFENLGYGNTHEEMRRFFFNVDDNPILGPLVMCVHVKFGEEEDSSDTAHEVIFGGAGVIFRKDR